MGGIYRRSEPRHRREARSDCHTDEGTQSGVARVGEPAVGEGAVQDQLPTEARAHGDQRKDMLILPQMGGEVGGEDALRVLAQAQDEFPHTGDQAAKLVPLGGGKG